jgi:hypothetical protein
MPPRHLQPTITFLQATVLYPHLWHLECNHGALQTDLTVTELVWSDIFRGALGIPRCSFYGSGCISVSLHRRREHSED